MEANLNELLQLFSDEELIRFRRRAEKARKTVLIEIISSEILRREQKYP